MKAVLSVVGALSLVAILAPAPANAQQTGNGAPVVRPSIFDLQPGITKEEFTEFTGELGSVLRFRQVGDDAPIGKGKVELSVLMATTPIEKVDGAWNSADKHLTRSMAIPQLRAKFGVSNRVNMGAWLAYDSRANYGIAGLDTSIALLKQSESKPVTISFRPSLATLVGPSDVWVATMSYDLSVSRAIGNVSPYAGVAASSSIGVERSDKINFHPATTSRTYAYAGVSCRLQALTVSAEVEKSNQVNFALRIGTRF